MKIVRHLICWYIELFDCKYKTDNKSNYNKHMTSIRHCKNNSVINFIDETSTMDNKRKIRSTTENEYMSMLCKKYAHAKWIIET